MTSFMSTSQSLIIVFTVDLDVFGMSLAELLNGSFDGLHTTFLSHRFGRKVGVASSSVPVTWDGLGVERDLDSPFLGDSDEQVSSNDKVVTHFDTFTRSNLELPLSGHDLGVDTRDFQSSVETSSVVAFDNVSSKDLSGTNTTVVWTLRSWETTLWPSVWLVINVEQGVFLFKTEPRLLSSGLLHDLVGVVSVVGLVGSTIIVVTFAQDDDVVTSSDRVLVVGYRSEVDVRVVTWSLVGGGTVKVPFLEFLDGLDGGIEGGRLASDFTISVDPDVFSLGSS